MKYKNYINELKELLKTAKTLFDAEKLDNNEAFRKWRQKLTALIIKAEENNYETECDVISRHFDLHVSYGPQPIYKERTKAFNQDLQDTINEMETIIEFYDKFGEPQKRINSNLTGQMELDYPSKVTISWLVKHAPINLWMAFVSIIISAFLLGLGFSQTVAYKNIQQLWQIETKDQKNAVSSKP